MSELIEREALKQKLFRIYPMYADGGTDVVSMRDINSAPTIKVVQVVRCGECEHAKCVDEKEDVYRCTHPQWTRHCKKDTYEESALFHGLSKTDYCSYGKRRESEGV